MGSGDFTDKTRKAVVQRANARCEVCGLTGASQIHHRKPRGMGGSGRREVRSAANAIYVHAACHRRIEANRTKAYLLGHLVHAWQQSESTAIRLWDGWFLLTSDGDRLTVER